MKRGFTLIELLVVMTIIGILLAILMPVISQAKVASARAISAHSLTELIVGGRAYLNDNDNAFWPYQLSTPNGMQWWYGLESFQSMAAGEGKRTADYSKGPLGPYVMASGGVKTDPALANSGRSLKPKYKNGNYGYGYNTVLAADSKGKARSALQVDSPAQMVVFATCAQVNTFQSPATPKKPMVEEFYMISDTQTTAHFRHGTEALAAFLDGSVRPLSMAADMQPGSKDTRLPSANIGRFKTSYVRQAGW
ncbi:MAG: type II secretion system protein [Chthoniobacter sp.]|uniref:type II secretion system protein n=1 Tax=Chthoniobacter sp. TaxID=2510640 RepID=UPI0032A508EF